MLKELLHKDSRYAWSWHCNIAISFQDEGGTHEQSNRAAARFMSTSFGLNMEEFEEWKSFDWAQKTASELRDMSASEAVYGLLAWLTCREAPVTLGSSHDAAIAAELAKEFCDENELLDPSPSNSEGNVQLISTNKRLPLPG